ncbi:HAD family hydrolase [Thermosulfurimonas sp. F29]|uniref:HAD family hydrolase n=1 Tax=Thermosulfurimonas sp. F29 TaxID=2867247 RepID=UPI001C832695|nr:HAD family hydrolase [Thermosulfurimonas sp. F29]MBX6422230.1 HAD family hydrolase [Thermosulfurimonas sp. F29]
MRPKLLVFDCDGVLFDSREANRAYYEDICRALGRGPLSEEELHYVHMHTAEESVKYLFRNHPEKLPAALEYHRNLPYEKFLRFMRMEPGLKEFLEWARPRFRLAISTNRTTTMGRLLEIYGLKEYFDLVMTALRSPKPKPHPEALTVILNHFRVTPSEALYIGDSEVDLRLCRAVGVPLVAYRNPSLSADYHVKSYRELRTLLSFPTERE